MQQYPQSPDLTGASQQPPVYQDPAAAQYNAQHQATQAQYEQQYGPGNYVPNVFVQYWSMRVMAYLATAIVLLSLWGAWLLYRRTLTTSNTS